VSWLEPEEVTRPIAGLSYHERCVGEFHDRRSFGVADPNNVPRFECWLGLHGRERNKKSTRACWTGVLDQMSHYSAAMLVARLRAKSAELDLVTIG
jgi:hypothetical protein